MNLNEKSMVPGQKIETKRAWMAGAGQLLILFRNVISKIKEQDKAVLQMEDLLSQVQTFWDKENQQPFNPQSN